MAFTNKVVFVDNDGDKFFRIKLAGRTVLAVWYPEYNETTIAPDFTNESGRFRYGKAFESWLSKFKHYSSNEYRVAVVGNLIEKQVMDSMTFDELVETYF